MADLRCSRCQALKSPDDFHVATARKKSTGRQAYCKTCCSERAREYRAIPENRARILAKRKEHYQANRERLLEDQRRRVQENPDRVAAIQRRSIIKRKYGLSEADYDAMVTAQRGRCAICLAVPETRLYIDHDHDTGTVRGLLCSNCNTALGGFRDSVFNLHSAIRYLKTSSATTPVLDQAKESA